MGNNRLGKGTGWSSLGKGANEALVDTHHLGRDKQNTPK